MTFMILSLLLWAIVATILLFRNPMPFPDRGHRLYGVPDERAQGAVLNILRKYGLPTMFRFRIGPTNQAVAWDGMTVIHFLDATFRSATSTTGTGISLAVSNPRRAAEETLALLAASGYQAEEVMGADEGLPSNHLVVIKSDAFLDWVLVFRRSGWQMAQVPTKRLPKYPD